MGIASRLRRHPYALGSIALLIAVAGAARVGVPDCQGDAYSRPRRYLRVCAPVPDRRGRAIGLALYGDDDGLADRRHRDGGPVETGRRPSARAGP